MYLIYQQMIFGFGKGGKSFIQFQDNRSSTSFMHHKILCTACLKAGKSQSVFAQMHPHDWALALSWTGAHR